MGVQSFLDVQQEFLDWLNLFGGVPAHRNDAVRGWLRDIRKASMREAANIAYARESLASSEVAEMILDHAERLP